MNIKLSTEYFTTVIHRLYLFLMLSDCFALISLKINSTNEQVDPRYFCLVCSQLDWSTTLQFFEAILFFIYSITEWVVCLFESWSKDNTFQKVLSWFSKSFNWHDINKLDKNASDNISCRGKIMSSDAFSSNLIVYLFVTFWIFVNLFLKWTLKKFFNVKFF